MDLKDILETHAAGSLTYEPGPEFVLLVALL